MTPFHPKLRRALLRDKEHRARGLTNERLLAYEGLITQLFYLQYYHDPYTPPNIQQLVKDIEDFRRNFLPNFDQIKRQWLAGQKKAAQNRYLNLNPGGIAGKSFALLWTWFSAFVVGNKRDYANKR